MRNRTGTSGSNQTTPVAAPDMASSVLGGASGVPTDEAGRPMPMLVPEAPVVADATENTPGNPEPTVQRYRVSNGGHVMVNGYRTVMRVGKIVDERTFDLNSLRHQGIKLDPLEG